MAESSATEQHHGRRADSPREVLATGWRDILRRVKAQLPRHHVSLVAAGVGFYGLLAVFPALTAIVSIWGLMLDPETLAQQIEQLSGVLPSAAHAVVADQAARIAESAGTGTSLAAIGGILLALFSSIKGVKSLIDGLNIIHEAEETRGFLHLNLLALALTLALILIMIGTLGLLVVYPLLVGLFGFHWIVQTLISLARWPLLALVAVAGLAILFRYGPSRRRQEWRWVGCGALAGTVLWIAGSIAFSIYMQYFGAYNETYGTLGAAIAVLTWFWLSAFSVLLGAEISVEMERHAARSATDTAREGQ